MQFTVAITALFAVAASAASIDTSLVNRDISAVSALQAQAEAWVASKEAAGCSKLKCFAALAPTVVSCAAALAEGGLNPIADAACLATLTNTAINKPAACSNC